MSEGFPRLRYLEAFPVNEEGQTSILLRDPWQISDQAIVVTPEVYTLLAMLDGTRSVREIQTELSRRSGQLVYEEQVQGILDQLDALLFLDNAHFQHEKGRLLQEFRAERIRYPAHAGAGYPDSGEELRQLLDTFYDDPAGAGRPEAESDQETRAIVAPHIDLRLGGPIYTHAYRRLGEGKPADVFVILGIGHMGLPRLFSVGRKDFQTPLGLAPFDREFVAALDQILGPESFAEELNHRLEHTVEFQVLFLQHLYPNRTFSIVPVLTSFSYEDLEDPRTADDIERFSSALGEAAGKPRRRVCFVVSVDLAHLGPRYGDRAAPDTRTINESLAADREVLTTVAAGDANGFLHRIRGEEDRRRTCGFSAIYTFLKTYPNLRGELLAHSHCQIDDSGSMVSYASLAFPA